MKGWVLALAVFALPFFASAASYSFPSGFSSVQGQNGWHYQYGSGSTFTDMTWDATNSRWKGNEMYVLIGNGWTSPGNASDAALAWTAPSNGTVHITGTVSNANLACGDGVAPSILLNTSTLWQSVLNNVSATSTSFDLTRTVASGDTVRFLTNRRTVNTCDTTYWSATVAYPTDKPPRGDFSFSGCSTGIIGGWAQDEDIPDQPIDVHLYIDAPSGSGAFVTAASASQYAASLCAPLGSCNHLFQIVLPARFYDGQQHTAYVYGINNNPTGANSLLGTAKTFQCAAVPPLESTSLNVRSNDTHIKVESVGNIETVYNHSTDKCEPRDVADTSVHAFRSADGTVNLVGNSWEGNYRAVGLTLDTVKRNCTAPYRSANDATFGNFKYHEWLFSPYTLDGTNVFALTHNEWYPSLGGFCPVNTGAAPVVGAITLLTSSNGGASYTHPSNYKVGVPSVSWQSSFSCNIAYGDWNVSNIIAKDGYYYALFNKLADPSGVANSGTCTMRTQDLASASSWTVWTGMDWRPMSSTFRCGVPTGLESWVGTVVESVVYSTYLQKYVALAIDNSTHVMYSTSRDLLHWSAPQTIIEKTELSSGDGLHVSQGRLWYGSLIDPTDTSRNFENIGREPYLYFSFNGPGAYNNIIRQKIRFTDLDVPQTYAFPGDLSTVQGTKQWFYQYGTTTPYIPMAWDAANNRWKGNETYVLVGAWGLHPGSNADAVLKWVAPQSGTISITGNVADSNASCGDGVAVSILRNSDSLWREAINNGDSTGFTPTLSVAVTAGDAMYFVVNRRGDNSCDSTKWSPTISISAPSLPGPYVFSSGYSSTQGGNQWLYRYGTTPPYAPMAWDAANNRWKGNETYVLVGKGWLHPGQNADAAVEWVAPKDGTVRVTGTASDLNGSCGDGVAVSILRGATPLWQQTINNNDNVGKSHNFLTAVTAGDKLYFNVNKIGNNACDTTGWDPTVTYQSTIAQASHFNLTGLLAAVVMAPLNIFSALLAKIFVVLGIGG